MYRALGALLIIHVVFASVVRNHRTYTFRWQTIESPACLLSAMATAAWADLRPKNHEIPVFPHISAKKRSEEFAMNLKCSKNWPPKTTKKVFFQQKDKKQEKNTKDGILNTGRIAILSKIALDHSRWYTFHVNLCKRRGFRHSRSHLRKYDLNFEHMNAKIAYTHVFKLELAKEGPRWSKTRECRANSVKALRR